MYTLERKAPAVARTGLGKEIQTGWGSLTSCSSPLVGSTEEQGHGWPRTVRGDHDPDRTGVSSRWGEAGSYLRQKARMQMDHVVHMSWHDLSEDSPILLSCGWIFYVSWHAVNNTTLVSNSCNWNLPPRSDGDSLRRRTWNCTIPQLHHDKEGKRNSLALR